MRPIKQVGTTERTIGVLILLCTCGIGAAFVVQVVTNEDYLFNVDEGAYAGTDERAAIAGTATSTPDSRTTSSPFPDSGLEDWLSPRQVAHYSPAELYKKIDGRAPAYLERGCVGLTFGRYKHRGDPARTLDVYWYDMGEPENAVGMYRAEAAPGAESAAIGNEAYQIGGAVYFWKGANYVQMLPAGLDPDDAEAARAVARRIAEAIRNR
jgi:hypothetical protein